MAITGFSHMALCVSDLDAALHFYCDILGFTKVFQVEHVGTPERSPSTATLLEIPDLDISLTFVQLGQHRIELIDMAKPKPTGARGHQPFNRLGYTHLSVTVAHFDEELARLRKAGVQVLENTIASEPNVNARFAMILDPDGNRIELFGKIDENGRNPWEFD